MRLWVLDRIGKVKLLFIERKMGIDSAKNYLFTN